MVRVHGVVVLMQSSGDRCKLDRTLSLCTQFTQRRIDGVGRVSTKSTGARVPGRKNLKIIFDLRNNADTVLFRAQNLQVITIHNCLCCMGVLCAWL